MSRRAALLAPDEALAALVEELRHALDPTRAVRHDPLRLAHAVAERLDGARLPSVAQMRLQAARDQLPKMRDIPVKMAARMLHVTPRTIRKIRLAHRGKC